MPTRPTTCRSGAQRPRAVAAQSDSDGDSPAEGKLSQEFVVNLFEQCSFTIPLGQRPYSWQAEAQVDQLLRDLEGPLLDSPEADVNDLPVSSRLSST